MLALRQTAPDDFFEGFNVALPAEHGPERLEIPDTKVDKGGYLKSDVEEETSSRVHHVTVSGLCLEIKRIFKQEVPHYVDGEVLGLTSHVDRSIDGMSPQLLDKDVDLLNHNGLKCINGLFVQEAAG